MAKVDCPQCGGSGWKTVERDGARVAVRCDCTASDRETRILERARIPRRYEPCTFANYDLNLYDTEPDAAAWNGSLEQAKLVVQAFARDYPLHTEYGLLLMGPAGVGKTHLAVAALREIALRGCDGLFYDYNELLKEIQHSYNPESQTTEMDVLEPVLATPLLVLDDLGASKPSAWALETVGHILNTRYNNNRLSLITTNFLDAEMSVARGKERTARVQTFPSGQVARAGEETLAERIGQRVRSRLHEMCRTIHIVAPDYRREIHQARHGLR
jgi:DNA replication protein DnaC